MTEQAHTSPSGESGEDKHVNDVSHSVSPCSVPADNDCKPSLRVKQAAFNSSAGIYNPPATGKDCLHNTRWEADYGLFPLQTTAKIDPALCWCVTGSHQLQATFCMAATCCFWRGWGAVKAESAPCSLSGGGCSWHSLASSSWDAPLQWDHSESFILPSCWGLGSKPSYQPRASSCSRMELPSPGVPVA